MYMYVYVYVYVYMYMYMYKYNGCRAGRFQDVALGILEPKPIFFRPPTLMSPPCLSSRIYPSPKEPIKSQNPEIELFKNPKLQTPGPNPNPKAETPNRNPEILNPQP